MAELMQFIPHIAGYLLAIIVSLLVGFTIRERRHEKVLSDYQAGAEFKAREMRKLQQEMHQKDLDALRAALNEWDKTCGVLAEKLDVETKRANLLDAFRKVLVEYLCEQGIWNFPAHGNSAGLMLGFVLEHARSQILDVNESPRAKNLFVRGVRKGAKQGREQMRKLMQKSLDNQATTIQNYHDVLCDEQALRLRYRKAVEATVKDKIALPGVRRAFFAALEQDFALRNDLAKSKGE